MNTDNEREAISLTLDFNYYFSHLDAFPIPGFFDGVNYPHEVLERVNPMLNELLNEHDVHEMRGISKGNSTFHGCYFIDEGTIVYNDVTIIGPVYIGKNCEIMPGVILRPYTIIGDNCVIGHDCEIKHTVAFNGAKLQSGAFVGDSVIGKSARVGSGVIIANRKFNQSNATARNESGKIDLGTSFFGCVLGDNARLGANSVTQPGTHIGPYTWVYPMTCVRGFIPRQKRVYHERSIVMEDNDAIDLKP